jgi:fatty acid desaturase
MSTADVTVEERRAVPRRRGSEYAELMRSVRQAGLLERRPFFYAAHIAVNLTMLVGGWMAFVLVGDTWWQLVTAAFLAVVFAQSGFIGHDAGHRQIFRSWRANRIVGWVQGNLAIGLAFGWWVDKHHRHHAHPNQEGLDPDIDGTDIAYTSGQAAARRHPLTRFFARHQGVLFFPATMLLGLSLHIAGVKTLLRRGYRDRAIETVLLLTHLAAYVAVVLVVLSPLKALVFIVVQQGLFGLYLGCAFAPNHKGMPILGRDDDSDFLRRQVLTARNVRGGWFTDVLLGGLNYQIEHHLFPSMPRPALRHAQPMVRAFCESHGLPYVETSLVDSYRQALSHLHAVGQVSRT